jgi:hypothetical protein
MVERNWKRGLRVLFFDVDDQEMRPLIVPVQFISAAASEQIGGY